MKLVTLIALLTSAFAAKVPLKDLPGRIINGDLAAQGQFPWQVGVYMDETQFCGGAIISNLWVLTAGHCVYQVESFRVVIGSNNVVIPDANSLQLITKKLVLHEGFNYDLQTNDIGLILLPETVLISEIAEVIPLAENSLEAGVKVTVSGFGKTSDISQSISPYLRYVELVAITNEECQSIYDDEIYEEMLCASQENNGICDGDSGGPLVANASIAAVHVGIASFAAQYACERGYPSGFTRTGYYRSWIRGKTGV